MALVLVVIVPSSQFILRPTIRHVFTPWHLFLYSYCPSSQFILRPTIRHVFTPWHWFLYRYCSLISVYLKTDDSTLTTPWHWFLYRYCSLISIYLKTDNSTRIYTMALVLVVIVPSAQFILRPTIRHVFTSWHWFLYRYCSLISVYLKTDNSTRIYTMALVLVQLLFPHLSLS
jgi:hypothetical protein